MLVHRLRRWANIKTALGEHHNILSQSRISAGWTVGTHNPALAEPPVT